MSDDPNQLRIEVRDGIHLSAIGEGDKAALVRFLNDKDIYNNTLRIPYPYSDEDAENFIGITAEATAKHGHAVNFAIRDDDDQLIGGYGFSDLSYEHCAEIAYWLAKPYWGQGIMTDVVRSACAFAVAEWKLVRITAHVFEFNNASAQRLYTPLVGGSNPSSPTIYRPFYQEITPLALTMMANHPWFSKEPTQIINPP